MESRERCRAHLERALFEEGYETDREFADAIGFSVGTLRKWLRCKDNPGPVARAAIAEALGLCYGADCDEVREADIDWLLEPCDVYRG